MTGSPLIFIVEDEPKLAALAADYLGSAGYRTKIMERGDGVVEAVRRSTPDLLLLDVMLPGKSGLDICREIRMFSSVPILMTTARVEEIDRLLGLARPGAVVAIAGVVLGKRLSQWLPDKVYRAVIEGLLAEGGQTVSLEKKYAVTLKDPAFTLVGKPDRLDMTPEGRLRIVDYKTGAPPTEKQQAAFAKQLHLAAVMASLGGFPEVGFPDEVEIAYIRLAADLKTVSG